MGCKVQSNLEGKRDGYSFVDTAPCSQPFHKHRCDLHCKVASRGAGNVGLDHSCGLYGGLGFWGPEKSTGIHGMGLCMTSGSTT